MRFAVHLSLPLAGRVARSDGWGSLRVGRLRSPALQNCWIAAALVVLVFATPAVAAEATHSILDLQPWQKMTESVAADGTKLRLVDLNPTVGRWYLLSIGRGDDQQTLHLETPDAMTLALGQKPGDLVVSYGKQQRVCALDAPDGLTAALQTASAYAPLCGGLIWLRRPAHGQRSVLEATTDMLRATGSVGETLINFYKNNFNDTAQPASYGAAGGTVAAPRIGPPPAVLAAGWNERTESSAQLGITVDGAGAGGFRLGTWYPAHHTPGVYATVLTPEAAGVANDPGHANEAYFVAWDMGRYALRYTLGATHPMLGWSNRAPLPHDGPGPDGFDNSGPLARIGMVPPYERALLAGSFAGGFKREHGAFKSGEPIGLHYGFAEDGVVFSRLNPGLVTIFAGLDGMPHIRTFGVEDARKGALGLLVARQAGLSLVENGKDGPHANDINGNWSGSNDGHLLTMRAGVCVLPADGTSYLVYGVFSAATPHAMAATFRAFGCSDAALLDMNSPVLVYGAIYHAEEGRVTAEHLTRPMAAGDDGTKLKFVDEPDSRDFFYLIKRQAD
jgi:hypothetical protein